MWDPPAVATRPTDRQRADPELGEFEDFEDPLAPRDDSSLPARRSAPLSHESFSAVFGQSTRTGRWSAPDRITAVAWFGEVKLDFREAEIASDGVVEVDATAVFGDTSTSSISVRASPISRRRLLRSFLRHRRKRCWIRGSRSEGTAFQSGSSFMIEAKTSETPSPANAFCPANIS